jgi:hypothetical protein
MVLVWFQKMFFVFILCSRLITKLPFCFLFSKIWIGIFEKVAFTVPYTNLWKQGTRDKMKSIMWHAGIFVVKGENWWKTENGSFQTCLLVFRFIAYLYFRFSFFHFSLLFLFPFSNISFSFIVDSNISFSSLIMWHAGIFVVKGENWWKTENGSFQPCLLVFRFIAYLYFPLGLRSLFFFLLHITPEAFIHFILYLGPMIDIPLHLLWLCMKDPDT